MDRLSGPVFSGQRNRAIVLTAVLTGLRREKLIALTARAEGGKLRYRDLPGPAWDTITTHLAVDGRSLDTLDGNARIVPISSQMVYENLQRYGRAMRVEGLTIHTLLRTAANLGRRFGSSLEDVQALLGDANIETTARYLVPLERTRDTGWQAPAYLLEGEHPHG